MKKTKTIYTFQYSALKTSLELEKCDKQKLKSLEATLLKFKIKSPLKLEDINYIKMLVYGLGYSNSLETLEELVITKIREMHGVDFNEETNADTYFIDFDR